LDEAEWRKAELDNFTRDVRALCQRGVLHQGFEHRCTKCLHSAWIAIDAVKKTIVCEVCGTSEAAQVSTPWRFRLNEFVREALRKHGILPLFWALSKLREFPERSFFFEGPLDVFFDHPPWAADGPDGDIDLIVVSNGRVSICEVKQSGRQLRRAEGFSASVRRLRPDVGVIAVMEQQTPQIAQGFRRFADTLQGTGIEARLITLHENDFEETI
jgi:hypothetical protein